MAKGLTFKEVRDQINSIWDRYGDELGDLVVSVQDDDGIWHLNVVEVLASGGLYIITEELRK